MDSNMTARAESSQAKASSSASSSPTSLHDVILDYVFTNAYASTAQALAQTRNRHSTTNGGGASGGGSNGVNANGAERDEDGDVSMDGAAHDGSGMSSEDTNGDGSGDVSSGSGSRKGRVMDEGTLQAIERRRTIINHILNGAIIRAVDALNAHYPSVLADPTDGSDIPAGSSVTNGGPGSSNGHSDRFPRSQYQPSPLPPWLAANPISSFSPSSNPNPNPYSMPSSSSSSSLFSKSALGSAFSSSPSPSPATSSDHALPVLPHSTQPQHVRLNLSIQQFIESFRQLTPSSPSSPSSSISSLTSSNHLNGSGILGTGPPSTSMTLTHALSAAQGLHAEAKKLPAEDRAVYLQEIKDVGALFAYSEPETSILKGFLEQGRRIALAEQVNRAILYSEHHSTYSLLEAFTRRTSATYAIMSQKGLDTTPPWTAADGEGKQRLAMWMRSKKGFKLGEFVSQSWH